MNLFAGRIEMQQSRMDMWTQWGKGGKDESGH